MANQDPQPEIYTTRHTFDASAVLVSAGTTNLVSVYTNQANNEEVRIYGVAVRVLMFPSPVLVLFQQPLAVVIEAKTAIAQAADRKRTVVVDLIGELAIQKAPPGYRNQ